MDTSNPVFFIVDCMKQVANVLSSSTIPGFGGNLWSWSFMFIFAGMVVSVFWRGARG